MAYCLALSLKATQHQVSALTVMVERAGDVPDRYRDAFDCIIEMPGPDRSTPSGWRVENYSQLYDVSPYDETVTLDADMLFFEDVSDWWNQMSSSDLVATASVLDYRGRIIEHNPLRESFYVHGLPDIHNGFFYFKKCTKARRLFATIGEYAADWAATCDRHFGTLDVHYSSDCALALATQSLGLERECTPPRLGGIPHFIHMKTCMQGWPGATDRDWRKYVSHSFADDLSLTIGGYAIRKPFHYHLRDFIDEPLLAAYESAARRVADGGCHGRGFRGGM
jgi:hypothetical protein